MYSPPPFVRDMIDLDAGDLGQNQRTEVAADAGACCSVAQFELAIGATKNLKPLQCLSGTLL
jgi:hypothetical protein